MQGEKTTGLNVGASSILVIFVLLCLATFATLSLVSANADMNLTNKIAEANLRYYQADGAAEEKLAEIDDELLISKNWSASDADYMENCRMRLAELEGVTTTTDQWGQMQVLYSVPVSDTQELAVVLTLTDYSQRVRYERTLWQVQNTQEREMEEEGFVLFGAGDDLFDLLAMDGGENMPLLDGEDLG